MLISARQKSKTKKTATSYYYVSEETFRKACVRTYPEGVVRLEAALDSFHRRGLETDSECVIDVHGTEKVNEAWNQSMSGYCSTVTRD